MDKDQLNNKDQESENKTVEHNFSSSNAESKEREPVEDQPINKNFNDDKPQDHNRVNNPNDVKTSNTQTDENQDESLSDKVSVRSAPSMKNKPMETFTEDEKRKQVLIKEFVTAYKKLEKYCTDIKLD